MGIDPAHRLDRIGDDVLEPQVVDLDLRVGLAERHRADLPVVPQIEQFLPQRRTVDPAKTYRADDLDQPRDRGHHRCRIAVRLDQHRVGIDRQQFGQMIGVFLHLEHPARAGVFPREVLEPHLVDAVTEARVRVAIPGVVTRQTKQHRRVDPLERGFQDHPALLRNPRADRVGLEHIGPGSGEIGSDIGVERIGAGIGREGRGLGRGRRRGDLPLQRCAHLRVGPDQRVEDRGPATRQAEDEHRAVDHHVGDFGMRRAVGRDCRQPGKIVLKLRERPRPAFDAQPVLGSERGKRGGQAGRGACGEFTA